MGCKVFELCMKNDYDFNASFMEWKFEFDDEIRACKALVELHETILAGTTDPELEKIVDDMQCSYMFMVSDFMQYLEVLLKRHQDLSLKLLEECKELRNKINHEQE